MIKAVLHITQLAVIITPSLFQFLEFRIIFQIFVDLKSPIYSKLSYEHFIIRKIFSIPRLSDVIGFCPRTA